MSRGVFLRTVAVRLPHLRIRAVRRARDGDRDLRQAGLELYRVSREELTEMVIGCLCSDNVSIPLSGKKENPTKLYQLHACILGSVRPARHKRGGHPKGRLAGGRRRACHKDQGRVISPSRRGRRRRTPEARLGFGTHH